MTTNAAHATLCVVFFCRWWRKDQKLCLVSEVEDKAGIPRLLREQPFLLPSQPPHLSRTGRGADIFPQMSLVHVSHTLSHIRACPLSTTNLSTHAR